VLGVSLLLIGLGVWWVVSQNAAQPAGQAGAGAGPGGMGGGGRGGKGGRGGPPAVVNTAKLTSGDMPVVLNALGTVTPAATVTVKTQLSGQLMSLGFTEGQTVTKGQFLAQIDPRPYQQQLAVAEATLAKDQAQLQNARLDLKRYQTLLSQDSVARQQVDAQQALVRQLEAQVKADEASVGSQKLNLTYARITAPVSGKVGLRQVDAGNYVTAGDANGIVSIAQVAPIDVAFTLPEDSLPQVARQMKAGAKLAVEVYDRAGTALLAKGSLTTLDNLIDTTTGAIRAKARFANADGMLFPNQFVNVRLTVQVLKNAVIAPTSAVLRGQQGMFVYVVDDASKVHVRPIQPGPAQGEQTAILSGVNAGETVVTDGTDRLREGMTVILPGACPPAGMGGFGAKKPGGGGGGLFGFGGGKPAAGKGAGFGGGMSGCKPGAAGGAGGSGPSGAGPSGAPGAAASAGGGDAAPAQGMATGMGGGGGRPRAAGSAAPAADGGAPAPAAGQGGGGGGRMQAMVAELGLDAAQQAKADTFFAEAREKAMASDDPDARRSAMREAFGKLAGILRPDQKAKLDALRARMAEARGQAQ
jgi:multidrug efflux system membrane fusion protein